MIDLSPFLFPSVLCLLLYAFLQTKTRKIESRAPYPPGPPPKPIIGNFLDIPFKQDPWLKYIEWSKRLQSDIVHMSVLNTHIVVLHKYDDMIALLEKRSGIYSDRPILPVAEFTGMNAITPTLHYGDRLRTHRRIFQETLRKSEMSTYQYLHTKIVHLFLGELLKDPEEFVEHCKWVSAASTLEMVFGRKIEKDDPIVQATDFVATEGGKLGLPGQTLINIFPILGRIPPWVPGASAQKVAAKVKETVIRSKTEPFQRVVHNLAIGTQMDCILAKMLQKREEKYDEDILRDAMVSLHIAGGETLQSTQVTFILACALHPSIQRKAQVEIDRITGTDRLPNFADRPSLPYIEALYREVLRWRPSLRLGFPHSSAKDDLYKGFCIPKGAVVLQNIWAVTRDEAKYPDPERFMPERFFNEDGELNEDTVDYVFGFGRRVCPGKNAADSLLWLMIACTLSAFNISKARDDDGNEIHIDGDAFATNFITHALPFKCSIMPRSRQAEELIRSAVHEANEA